MRVYRSDGSFVERAEDTAFGWFLADIVVDESVPEYELRNRDLVLKSRAQLYPSLAASFDLCEEALSATETVAAAQLPVHALVQEQRVLSVVETCTPETFEHAGKLRVPSQADVVKLIDPCTVESRVLLSVVHYAKYKSLIRDVTNLGDVRNSSGTRLIRKNSHDLRDELRNEIRAYEQIKDENMMSLMMELVLNDLRCDLSDIAECPSPTNMDSSGVGDSINTNSSASNSLTVQVRTENRDDVLEEGISIIDRSIDKMCEETYDIHLKISEIKRSFQEDEVKVNALIEEAQTFEKSLRETKFLNDLLHFLNGDLTQIDLKLAPFRILHKSRVADHEVNLIV